MAELQMRLKQYDKAEKTIIQALEVESHNTIDLNSMLSQAKLLNLLAKVRNCIYMMYSTAHLTHPRSSWTAYKLR